MWQCGKCQEKSDDNFETCWNCGTSKDGVEDPEFRKVDALRGDPIACPRCNCKLDFMGTKKFHEGMRWGILGDLAELFVSRESFDVFCCPRCGRVEFFIDGIGKQFRPH